MTIGDMVWVAYDPDGIAIGEDAITVHYSEPKLPDTSVIVVKKTIVLP